MECNTTFWNEICKYKILVPDYQRDYAQGRCDGGRVDNIRDVFVDELFASLKGNDVCHLGLIFGSYDELDGSGVFVAVDGQQRLTTIFLLHWFIAWKENKLADYARLKNFSWETRSYSSQFIDLLFKMNQEQSNVIDAIKSNNNYFSIWEQDPSVKGMLIMLETIEKKYSIENIPLCEKIFSDICPIKYDILKLDKDSDGKTYLKMNSRGRSLTTFELFKSKILEISENLGEKFDNCWLDFMLKRAEKDKKFDDPDVCFMNFINEYTYLILKLGEKDKSAHDFDEFINAEKKDNLIDVPFISFKKYEPAFKKVDIFEKTLDWIISNYEVLKEIDDMLKFQDESFFLDSIIIKKNKPTFSHRAMLFASFKYAELTNYEKIDEILYKRWRRVMGNLIENSNIDSANITNMCKCINKIDDCDIYAYLSKGGQLSTFDQEQFKEETVKVDKIKDNPLWENSLINAEHCKYLKGKIWVLFKDGDNTTLNLFKERYALLLKIIENVDEYHLQKVLISYYDSNKPRRQINLKNDVGIVKTLLTNDEKGLFACFQKIQSDSINPNIKYQWIKDLATTQLLNNSRVDAKIVWLKNNCIVLWGIPSCKRTVCKNETWGNVVIGNYRTLLVDAGVELQNPKIQIKNTNFLSYFDINFKYKNFYFQWKAYDNCIYLMNEEWNGLDENNKPSEPIVNMTIDDFYRLLDKLIKQKENT